MPTVRVPPVTVTVPDTGEAVSASTLAVTDTGVSSGLVWPPSSCPDGAVDTGRGTPRGDAERDEGGTGEGRADDSQSLSHGPDGTRPRRRRR